MVRDEIARGLTHEQARELIAVADTMAIPERLDEWKGVLWRRAWARSAAPSNAGFNGALTTLLGEDVVAILRTRDIPR